MKWRENETGCHCRQLACNRPVVISSPLASQHQLELSICLLKVNCLHTYEAHVSHEPQSLQNAVGCLWRIFKSSRLLVIKIVNARFRHSLCGMINFGRSWREKHNIVNDFYMPMNVRYVQTLAAQVSKMLIRLISLYFTVRRSFRSVVCDNIPLLGHWQWCVSCVSVMSTSNDCLSGLKKGRKRNNGDRESSITNRGFEGYVVKNRS